MAPAGEKSKKRKADANVHKKSSSSNNSNVNNSNKQTKAHERKSLHEEVGYSPLTLQDIHDRIQGLCRRVPDIPEDNFKLEDGAEPRSPVAASLPVPKVACPYDKEKIREWATSIQIVLEEFHLLVACVSPATYIWGTDRSGAAEQNLSLLSSELVRSQEQILARVTPRLNDVLAPVVTLVTDKTITTKNAIDGVETKQNHFITTQEDPDYANLCYCILARNAQLLRQVVLANFDKLLQAVTDYLTAQHKDSQHDSRGFVY